MKIGCDVVDLRRVKINSLPFINGVLSKDEISIFEKRKDKKEFLGGRFAAKEAFLKALGCGISGARMNEIDIRYKENGQPYIIYKENNYDVSISHDGDYAFAVVVIL